MSALQIAFGGAARGVLDRLGAARAGYARMLSLHDLVPFDNAQQLEDLINAWVPAAGGGVSPTDFLALIRRWGLGPHAMEVAELIAAPGRLRPLRPEEAFTLLPQFLARADREGCSRNGGGGYSSEIHGQIGVGLAPRPSGAGDVRVFAVTHLAPFGGESVSMLALKAISCLFDHPA
jgi:hypothetical protein